MADLEQVGIGSDIWNSYILLYVKRTCSSMRAFSWPCQSFTNSENRFPSPTFVFRFSGSSLCNFIGFMELTIGW